MGIKDTTVTFALIFIFIFSLLTYGVVFANNNGATINIGNDDQISGYRTTSESDAILYTTSINGTQKAYSQAQLAAGTDAIGTDSVFKEKVADPKNALFNILEVMQVRIFGGSSAFKIIFTTITGTILIIGTFFLIKLWKGGNPD